MWLLDIPDRSHWSLLNNMPPPPPPPPLRSKKVRKNFCSRNKRIFFLISLILILICFRSHSSKSNLVGFSISFTQAERLGQIRLIFFGSKYKVQDSLGWLQQFFWRRSRWRRSFVQITHQFGHAQVQVRTVGSQKKTASSISKFVDLKA